MGHMWFIMPVIGFDFASTTFFFFFSPTSNQCLIKGLGTTLLTLVEGNTAEAAAMSSKSVEKE